MKKRLCILSFVFFALMICTAAYAAVEPLITANGMSGTVNIAADSAVTVSVQLLPGDKAGTDADWWLVAYAYGRWYYYQIGAGLTDIGSSLDIAKLRPVYQGKLFTLPSSVILQIPQVPAGTYSLYFGVDTDMNGKMDTDSLVFKAVNVVVGGSDSGTYGAGIYVSASRSETGKQYYEFPSLDSANLNQPSSAVQADKLVDFIPLQNGYGVRVIESGEQYILRIVPLSDPENGQVLSELVLNDNPYSGTITNGNMLYVVFSQPMFFVSLDDLFKYFSKPNTKIQAIDLSIPQSPVKRGSFELTGIYYPPMQTISSPQINAGLIFQTDGSVLVLPYSKGKAHQATPGEDLISLINSTNQAAYDAEKRVRVLDFSDPDQPKEISDMLLSDVRGVSRYFMNGRILYASHFRNTDAGSEYYLSKVDFSDLSAPLQSTPVKIPATCIGTDNSGMYAFTAGGCCGNMTLSSFRLGADNAELTDKAEIEGYYNSNPGTIIISDGFVYLGGYGGMVIADLSNPEKIGLYEYRIKDGENRSISIYSVKNRRIFAYSGSGVIDTQYMVSYDASNLPSLRPDSFFDRTGINIYHFAFLNDNAYLSLGYYGLWISSINN